MNANHDPEPGKEKSRVSDQAPFVLLVDDDQDFLDMTRGVLEARGYRVRCANGPRAALDILARVGLPGGPPKPQLIVTDLMMSATDSGFSFSRKVKEDPRLGDVPIIIVTAVSARLGYDFSPRRLEDLAAMRADAFFEKPLTPADLLAKVDELIALHEEKAP